MTTKQLGFKAPVALAIAAGATSPDPGIAGVWIWSSTASAPLYWNGSAWTGASSGPAVALNCRAATTSNITSLSTATSSDGVTFASSDLVLVRAQTTLSENGVYSFNGTGLVRASSMPAAATLTPGLLVTVSEGTLDNDSLWMLTTNGAPVVGTNSLEFKTFDNTTVIASGTAIIDFGSFPGSNETSVVVTGISGISTTSNVQVFVMPDDTTTDHTASDHRYMKLFAQFAPGTLVAGTGFTIFGTSSEKLQGTFALRFQWN